MIITCAGITPFRFTPSSCARSFSACICSPSNALLGSAIPLAIETDPLCDFTCSGVGMSACVTSCSATSLFFSKRDSA
ncbi:Uncharacterised protein [Vibrio cholerae]|nr:Uncharacterised protein [Vibrio cholerae]